MENTLPNEAYSQPNNLNFDLKKAIEITQEEI